MALTHRVSNVLHRDDPVEAAKVRLLCSVALELEFTQFGCVIRGCRAENRVDDVWEEQDARLPYEIGMRMFCTHESFVEIGVECLCGSHAQQCSICTQLAQLPQARRLAVRGD